MEELEPQSRPIARHYISAIQWGGSMWVFGGIGRNNYNDMARFWLTSPQRNAVQSSSVGQELRILVNNRQFADVCFLTRGGREIYAHRAILHSRCEHFRGMFDSGMRESYSINPIDISHIETELFLQIITWVSLSLSLPQNAPKRIQIYTGTINEDLGGEDVLNLLQLADQFLLPELRRVCAHMLRRFIKTDNVDDLLAIAEAHNSPQLQVFCQQYLEDHPH